MRLIPLKINAKTVKHLLCLVMMLLVAGCSQGQISQDTPTPDVIFGVTLVAPSPAPDTSEIPVVVATLSPIPGLAVKTYVTCYCRDNGSIGANISITPINGTPPYIIPGIMFVDSKIFSGNFGDVYHITVLSSDQPPLSYSGDLPLVCIPAPPSCDDNNNNNSSSSSKSKGTSSSSSSSVGSSSSSSVSSSSSSSVSSSSSSSVSSSSSSSVSSSSSSSVSSSSSGGGGPPGIPECPKKKEGGEEPPGICKKN